MDFKQALAHYWPFWTLGICMFIATYRSEHKDLLRFQPKSYLKFLRTMLLITAMRCFVMSMFPPSATSAAAVLKIPLWLTGTVGWEDCIFTLPLALAARFLGNSLPAKISQVLLTIMMMFSFWTGHLYQGVFAASLISLYIPIVSNLGKKHGFGTVMLCHMTYDFLTLFIVRLFVGF